MLILPNQLCAPWWLFLMRCRHIRGGQKQRRFSTKTKCKMQAASSPKQSAQRMRREERGRKRPPQSPKPCRKSPAAAPQRPIRRAFEERRALRPPAPTSTRSAATANNAVKKPSATIRQAHGAAVPRPQYVSCNPRLAADQGSPPRPMRRKVPSAGSPVAAMPTIEHPPENTTICAHRQRGGLPRRKAKTITPRRVQDHSCMK